MTRSVQPKPPAVAIVHQNGLSSASCRASVAVTPVWQIWWIQVAVADHRHVSNLIVFSFEESPVIFGSSSWSRSQQPFYQELTMIDHYNNIVRSSDIAYCLTVFVIDA